MLLSVITGSRGIWAERCVVVCGSFRVMLSNLRTNDSWRMWLLGFLSGWLHATLITRLLVFYWCTKNRNSSVTLINLLSIIFSVQDNTQRSSVKCMHMHALYCIWRHLSLSLFCKFTKWTIRTFACLCLRLTFEYIIYDLSTLYIPLRHTHTVIHKLWLNHI